MPAAQLCRAYCTRLRPSVTWSRPTSLALRQTPTTFRTIASVAVESNDHSSFPIRSYGDGIPSSRVDQQNALQNLSEASPTMPQEGRRLKLDGGLLSGALSPKTTTPRIDKKDPSHTVNPGKPTRTNTAGSRLPPKGKQPPKKRAWKKRGPTKRKKSESELLAEAQKKQREKERYMQWGYLRHQYSQEELLEARQKFNFWERKLQNIAKPKNPSSWPWRDDGKFMFDLGSVSPMRRAWEELDLETRKEKWPTVMLSTLQFCPDKAIQVLDATLNPLPPGYAINDVLKFIIKRLDPSKYTTHRERILQAEEVLDIFAKVIEDLPKGHVPLRQGDLGNLCQKLPRDQVEELYRILKRNDFRLHYNTLLHIASPLATHPTTKDTAFKILQEIADQGVDLNRSHCSSVITTLLHTTHMVDSPKPEGAFSPQQALEYFIEKGHTPNIINFTALLETFCLQGDVAEAVRLPLLLAETGVELDARCVATVFRGAKDSLKVEHIKGAFDVAKAANAPYVDVLNNALHSIFYFAEMESRENNLRAPWVTPVFGTMLRVYAKKFNLEPLQALIPDTLPLVLAHEHPDGTEKFRAGPAREWEFKGTIVPLVDEFFSTGPDNKVQPNSTTIAIMLRAYIRSLFSPHDILSFYAFYKSRLEESKANPHSAELIKAQSSIVHDTLIMVMCERGRLMRPALQVFGDMLKGSLHHKSDGPNKEPGTTLEEAPAHPAPSLFTFSILVHGLLMQGDRLMAEQVIQVMKEHNVQPNLVAWNMLAKGYAAMQNIPRTVGTFQDLEAAGFKPDVFTFKAFSRLRDQTRALKTMEQIIDANKKSFEESLGQRM